MANLKEGGRRLGAAGLVMLKISACVGGVALLLSFVPRFLPIVRFWDGWIMFGVLPMMVFPLTIWLAILGTALCVAGYVVRGFAEPRDVEFSGREPRQHPEHPLS